MATKSPYDAIWPIKGEMEYRLTIEWKGKRVMRAWSTEVMAYETVRGFFADNFAGTDHHKFMQCYFSVSGFSAAHAKHNKGDAVTYEFEEGYAEIGRWLGE